MKKYILALCSIVFSLALSSQVWENAIPLPTEAGVRHHPVTFSVGGFGYVGTGSNQLGDTFKDFYRYSPDIENWEKISDFPGPARGFAYGVTEGEKAYMGFGRDVGGIKLNDLWEYDPIGDQWKQLATCPCVPRTHPALLANNGKIYVGVGGADTGNLDDWWVYDIGPNTWSQLADFPGERRHHPFYFSIQEYLYVGFGHGQSIYDDLYRYDPSTDVWDQMASLPAEARVAGTQFNFDGKGYLLSGDGSDHDHMAEGEFWEYDPITNAWEQLPSHLGEGSRWAPGSFVIDGVVYLIGGREAGVDRKSIFKFDLASFYVGNDDVEILPISVFPNPTTDIIEIQLDTPIDGVYGVNMEGKDVSVKLLNNQRVDISHLPNGQYFLHVLSQEKIYKTLVIKI